MNKKIGVGIIGLSANGGWGATAHYPSLQILNQHFKIIGLVASTLEKAEKAAKKYSIDFFTDDVEKLAANEAVDLIVIAVNLPQHKKIIEKIAKYKKAIYCEWPLGINSNEATEIKNITDSYECKTFIGLQAITSKYILKIKELIASPTAGKLLSCLVYGSDPSRGKVINPRYIYGQYKENGVSTLTIPFAHMLSAILFIFGNMNKQHTSVDTKYKKILVDGSSTEIARTTIDHVIFNAKNKDNGFINIIYKGGDGGLLWMLESENIKLKITANSGHIQYEPLDISVINSDGSSELLPIDTSIDNNLVNTYLSVYSDMTLGTNIVPDFEFAINHQKILEDLT